MISDKVLRVVMLFIILYFFSDNFFIYLDKNKRQGVKGGDVVYYLVFSE